MDKSSKIFVAGHNGTVGSAVVRNLLAKGYEKITVVSSDELDLRNQQSVNDFFEKFQPDYVIDAAARVGGILANDHYPYTFIMDNLQIQNNLINASFKNEVKKFIFLGTSCVYPKMCSQPIKEEYLLSAALEPTNEWYAIAKIAGIKACEAIKKQHGRNFISLMPTNTYGPHDNFDLETAHVLPSLLRKFYEAVVNNHAAVTLWGEGSAMREFIYVDDLADAIVFVLENEFNENIYNIGTGVDLSIKELALLIQKISGHQGEIHWDSSKPNGTPRKVLDVSKLNRMGWYAKTNLEDGLLSTYQWLQDNYHQLREMKCK